MGKPLFAMSLAAGLLALGCGSGEPSRYAVSGKVVVKGEPVREGVLQFNPLEKQGSNATILLQNDGTYSVPRSKGLLPGKYKVAIIAYESASGSGEAPGVSAKKAVRPAVVIPPEYGSDSKQIVEVTEQGANTFDFIIK